ncbi:CRP-like cAMP-binding protein [Sphingomonas sp. SORGH_AS 950]|uniref:Crp/Fnr family transcriptional regulator n=1 Tax=Sphingomonas sp. SORGH_AS_0950 TaxID=3041792 RepID=UPI00277FCCD1|nr:helix-turn-helix domain-containing protein [Sphingomonas sp. SORGH_AS_0950]MDQ1156502.1 CRP-like cAMP-binding protein [Sphingomonas sp. SORGH_AS_0950]
MSLSLSRPLGSSPPALQRLSRLATLDQAAVAALMEAMGRSTVFRPRRELLVEGRDIVTPHLILSGWAARVRILLDGRRQFLNFVLPGDVVGLYHHARAVAPTTVISLTEVTSCVPPDWGVSPALDQAYAVGHALDEAYLLAQIARLGRMNAMERIGDLMLELHERLALSDLSHGRSFELPITQETLADALGLTAVHVNRMLQAARRAGDLIWSSRSMTIPDPRQLARKVGRAQIRVMAD